MNHQHVAQFHSTWYNKNKLVKNTPAARVKVRLPIICSFWAAMVHCLPHLTMHHTETEQETKVSQVNHLKGRQAEGECERQAEIHCSKCFSSTLLYKSRKNETKWPGYSGRQDQASWQLLKALVYNWTFWN